MPNDIVIIAEHADGKLKPVTYELLAFAGKLQHLTSKPIRVLLLGSDVMPLAGDIANTNGLDVTAFEAPELSIYNGEIYAGVLAEHLRTRRPA